MATFDPRASTTQRPMVRHLGCSPSSLHSTDPHPRLKLYQVLSLPGWTAPAAPTLVSDLAGRGSQASLVRGGEPLVGQGACLCSGTELVSAQARCIPSMLGRPALFPLPRSKWSITLRIPQKIPRLSFRGDMVDMGQRLGAVQGALCGSKALPCVCLVFTEIKIWTLLQNPWCANDTCHFDRPWLPA